jgi:mRNA interferase RelE/StbE
MALYKLTFKQSVTKDLRKIPRKDVDRILALIQGLTVNPRPPNSKKLSAQERYRIRQGDYRILYSIEDEELVVCVVKIGHRREIYR